MDQLMYSYDVERGCMKPSHDNSISKSRVRKILVVCLRSVSHRFLKVEKSTVQKIVPRKIVPKFICRSLFSI